MAEYSDVGIAKFTRALSTFVACLLPVASIVILYVLHNIEERLGVIAVLVSIFSICMLRFTTTDAGNIFAATAA